MGLLHRFVARRAPDILQTEIRLLHRLGFVRPPQAVQWIATSACDLACPHCYSKSGRRADGELTTDEARRLVIDELVRLDRPALVIAGGEALLRGDFAEIVEYAHRCDVPWALHTHGGHVRRWIDVFRRHTPQMVAVSVDGPRAFHDEFRGRKGCFDAALEAIVLLRQTGCPEVVAGTTITRHNADMLADMLPTIINSGAHSWGLHLTTPEGRAAGRPDMLPTPAQLRRAAAFARRMRAVFHIELDDEWGGAGGDDCFYRDDRFMCGAGRFSCVVSATGELMPCTTTDLAESQGSIRRQPLSRLWAERFEAFRAPAKGALEKAQCFDCWLQTRNGHSCRAAAFADRGDPFGKPCSPQTEVAVS
ncbi:MAG: radical SAM protein [Candidatus Nealsonbacteria bacterium]|nr:radical SAM protein [Candidatus Nealsonbacteria bacterium]